MQNMVGERRQSQQTRLGLVRPEYQNGYEIPLLPYQKRGILSREFWPSRDQIVRIIPGYDPETGEIFPQNINVNEFATDSAYADYLSDTFSTASIMSRFGGVGRMLIADYEPGSPEAERYGGNTVLRCFANTIFNSLKAEREKKEVRCKGIPDWQQWMGRQGKLPLPRTALLMQALMFKINGEYMQNRDANRDGNEDLLLGASGEPLPLLGCVAMAQKESTKQLLQALVEPQDNNKPLNALTNNKYGGMAEAEGNILYLNTVSNAEKTRSYLRPHVQEAAKGWNPQPFPLAPEQIKALWVPWKKLLHFMTPEEQMEVLVNEFGADSVNYVIGLDPRFRDLPIPEYIAKAGFGRYAQFAGNAKLPATAAAPVVAVTSPRPFPADGDEIPMGNAPKAPVGGLGGLGGLAAPVAPAPTPAPKPSPRNAMAPGLGIGLATHTPVDRDAIQRELQNMQGNGVDSPAASRELAGSLLEECNVNPEANAD